jgi:dCTP deaminase
MSILTGSKIKSEVEAGNIRITPYSEDQLNPASYDLTLGDELRVYKDWVGYNEHASPPRAGQDMFPCAKVCDVKQELETVSFQIPPTGWVLRPGIGYLLHTVEQVWTRNYVPIVDGKSSIGRLFVLIHFTAGFGDPNFDGQYTLEVSALHPVRIYPGMRIGQIRFHTVEGELDRPYEGNYKEGTARGAVASRSWNQFPKKDD